MMATLRRIAVPLTRAVIFGCILSAVLSTIATVSFARPANNDIKRHFDIPAGWAAETLKKAAIQADRQIVFSADLVAGVRTREVKGDYTALEAIRLMLEGQEVYPVSDEGSDALTIKKKNAGVPQRVSALRETNADATASSTVIIGRGSVGAINGTVTDAATKQGLAGVRVTVLGTAVEAFTDRQGNYQLPNVPASNQTVDFSYVGYPGLTRSVTVSPGAATKLDTQLGEQVIKLDAVVVTSAAVGQARAINQQRASDTLTNIVASDSVGRFPDQNAAEALSRVPGLSLYRDMGEGRFVIIRGINSQYNGVSINGFRAATSEKGTRTVPLDNVAAESIASLEVSKVATPDKDADGLGGSVDVKTRTALDYNGPVASIDVAGLYSSQEKRKGQKLAGFWGNTFLNGKLGVLVGVSTQYHPYSSFNYEGDAQWSLVTSPTDGQNHWRFNEADFRHYEPTRTRTSGNFSLDFRPDATLLIYLRGIFSMFDDREHRWMTSIPFSAGKFTALTDISATVTNVSGVLIRDRERDEVHRIGSTVLGWEKTAGSWHFDGGLSVNYGNEKRIATELYFSSINPASFTYSFSDYTDLNVVQTSGTSIADPTNYKLSTKSQTTTQTGDESVAALRQNARYDLILGNVPAFVKFGGVYSHKTKKEDYITSTFSAVPFTIASALEQDSQYPLFSGLRIDPQYVERFYKDPTGFTTDRALSKDIPADFEAHEDVTAAYAMGGATVDKLKIFGGVRGEFTDFDMTGYQLLNGTTVTPVSAARNYANWMPGLYLNYNATKKIILRASWSNTLSRPPFESAMIGRVVDDSKRTVSQGNPNLKTLEAENWDTSFEYYMTSLGMISVSPFYKSIRNFTYQTATGIDPATGYTLTSFLNGPTASIKGVELTWQQRLTFLPAPFNGLGFMTNASFTSSRASYPTRSGEILPFVGQSNSIGNLALNYEKNGLFALVGLSYNSKRLRADEAIGADITLDPYEDHFVQIDASVRYQFKHHWEIYANGVNLNNAPFRTYFQGGSVNKRLEQYEYYNWSANVGVRWSL